MDESNKNLIISKLDRIISLLTLTIIQEKDQTEQIRILSNAGFQPKEIAQFVGTTANTVRVSLFSIRNKQKIRRK